MRRHFRLFFLLIIVVSCMSVLQAQPTIQPSHQGFENVGENIQYFEDTGGGLQLHDVLALDHRFKSNHHSVFNFGITSSAYWFRLRYSDLPNGDARLIVDKPNIDSIQVYIPENGRYALYTPYNKTGRNTLYVASSYVFALPPADTATIYIRIRTSNILIVPIKVAAAAVTDEALIKRTALQGIYGGILFILFLVSFLVFVRLRETLYLYYSLYVFCLGAYVLLYLGGFGKIFHIDFDGIAGQYSFIFGFCGFIGAALFGSGFLDLKEWAPRLNKFVSGIVMLLLLGLVVSIIVGRGLGIPLVQFLGLVVTLTLLVSGIILLIKGVYTARFYVLAWGSLLIALLYTLFSYQGIVPFTDFSLQAVVTGSTVELCLLSIAMADRMRRINQQRENALEENVRLQKQYTYELEAAVQSRTRDLEHAYETIHADTQAKDDLLRIVVHDVRSPLASFYQMIELVEGGNMTKEEFDFFVPGLKKNTSQVLDTVGMLMQWVMIQKQGADFEKEKIILADTFADTVRMYAQLMDGKHIQCNINCRADINVTADRNHLLLVLRNLIDNAIKFTPHGGSIHISGTSIGAQTCIKVFNTATALPAEMITRLETDSGLSMSKGTADEKGIGLGLQLCREFLAKMNSRLQVKNTDGGIEFFFLLQ